MKNKYVTFVSERSGYKYIADMNDFVGMLLYGESHFTKAILIDNNGDVRKCAPNYFSTDELSDATKEDIELYKTHYSNSD